MPQPSATMVSTKELVTCQRLNEKVSSFLPFRKNCWLSVKMHTISLRHSKELKHMVGSLAECIYNDIQSAKENKCCVSDVEALNIHANCLSISDCMNDIIYKSFTSQ